SGSRVSRSCGPRSKPAPTASTRPRWPRRWSPDSWSIGSLPNFRRLKLPREPPRVGRGRPIARHVAPPASARLRMPEELLQRPMEAIRERQPTVLLEVTEALEAEVTAWAAQQEEEAGASGRDGKPDHPVELSPEERRLAQRVRTLYETNQAL